MMTSSTGYLVVLKTPERQPGGGSRLNDRYSGVNRIPAYPSAFPEEAVALDDYIFGTLKSENTNLIPDLASATDLLNRFSGSPREFEIILCCPGPHSKEYQALQPNLAVPLGYDVALVKGDGWSIVDDFASDQWATQFLTRLNEHGLFREQRDAEDYLRAYRQHQEPDADMPFEIVFVARVFPSLHARACAL
jgi:hypothetical protein